jgi:hypothetical protein
VLVGDRLKVPNISTLNDHGREFSIGTSDALTSMLGDQGREEVSELSRSQLLSTPPTSSPMIAVDHLSSSRSDTDATDDSDNHSTSLIRKRKYLHPANSASQKRQIQRLDIPPVRLQEPTPSPPPSVKRHESSTLRRKLPSVQLSLLRPTSVKESTKKPQYTPDISFYEVPPGRELVTALFRDCDMATLSTSKVAAYLKECVSHSRTFENIIIKPLIPGVCLVTCFVPLSNTILPDDRREVDNESHISDHKSYKDHNVEGLYTSDSDSTDDFPSADESKALWLPTKGKRALTDRQHKVIFPLKGSRAKIRCSYCGGVGHNVRTCTNTGKGLHHDDDADDDDM